MTRYDPDRIAALAAGLLSPAEAAAMEREIAADPRAAAELAAQRLALQALHQAPAPMLSIEERTELHRAVADALNLSDAARAEVVAPRRRVPWRPIAIAAAALAAIAVVVPLMGLLSVGGENAALTTVADFSAREAGEETATPLVTTLGSVESQTDDGDLAAGLPGSAGAEAEQVIAGFLADPAALIAVVQADLTTCASEATDLLGEEDDPAGATVRGGTGELVVWFVATNGRDLQRLAVFDPGDCRLLASHP